MTPESKYHLSVLSSHLEDSLRSTTKPLYRTIGFFTEAIIMTMGIFFVSVFINFKFIVNDTNIFVDVFSFLFGSLLFLKVASYMYRQNGIIFKTNYNDCLVKSLDDNTFESMKYAIDLHNKNSKVHFTSMSHLVTYSDLTVAIQAIKLYG